METLLFRYFTTDLHELEALDGLAVGPGLRVQAEEGEYGLDGAAGQLLIALQQQLFRRAKRSLQTNYFVCVCTSGIMVSSLVDFDATGCSLDIVFFSLKSCDLS